MPSAPSISPAARKFLRLHLCAHVGPIRFANLLRELGDIDAILDAPLSRLQGVNQLGSVVAEAIVRDRGPARANEEIDRASRLGVRILCLADDDYPAALRSLPDPPPCLYINGQLTRQDALAIGIVGSRHASRYGIEQAQRFGALVAGAGLTVVSGNARGIDAHAQQGALAAGGRVLAVLGCGLAHLYPPESVEMAEQVVRQGALLSELPLQTPPDSGNFLPRNRIIAGLSLGVLVVEAARRSGALTTARCAMEYNREVFALPGRVDTATADGCNALIRDGAKLVTNLEDILEELGEAGRTLLRPTEETNSTTEPTPPTALSRDEDQVLQSLADEAMTIDGLCEGVRLPPGRVAVALTGLQLKGLVRQRAGAVFERARRE